MRVWTKATRLMAGAAAALSLGAQAATITIDFGLQSPLVLDEGQAYELVMSSQYLAGTSYTEFAPYHCYRFGFSSKCGDVVGFGTAAGRTQSMTFYRNTLDHAAATLFRQSLYAHGAFLQSTTGRLMLSYADEGTDTVTGSASYDHLRDQWGRDCSASHASNNNFVLDAWCTTLRNFNETVGYRSAGSARLDVVIRNVAPTITELAGPLQVLDGQQFTFSAMATDPGVNDLLSYRWDLDNDGAYDDATGREAQWSFSGAGRRTITLEVSDGDGGVTVRTTTVDVAALDATLPGALPLPGSLALLAAGVLALAGLGIIGRMSAAAAQAETKRARAGFRQRLQRGLHEAREAAEALRTWPWTDTYRTLRERFGEDRLGLTAGSLTFTTLIALVPLLTVMLAVFTAFPMFASFQTALEQYFLQSLVPDSIAKPVLRSLNQFAGKARGMGSAGLALLVITALALMLTIDRTLNAIWRVKKPRPIGQRVLVYWAALTLGPLLLGVSLSVASYAVSSSRGLVSTLPGGIELFFDLLQFVLVAAGMAGLFHYVPNTYVRWKHAWAGALFVAAGIEVAKVVLAWYVAAVPSFSAVYGAFASVPILLLWVYLVWVVVLLGAVVAAYAPSLQMGLKRPDAVAGRRFETALAVLRNLRTARDAAPRGLSLPQLSEMLATDPLSIEEVIEQLAALDLVGRLDEEGLQRLVLLGDPALLPAAPLLDALLVRQSTATRAFRRAAGLDNLRVQDLLDT